MGFFWDSTVFLLIFLQKCCTVPKNQSFFCKSAVLFQKNQSCGRPVVGSSLKTGFFLVFLGQYSTFAKKDWFFWDSTVFLLIFLQKCCTVPKKPIFFCKSAVLFQKNQSCGRPVVGSSLKTGIFFVFLGQYSTFAKKDWFFWDSTVFLLIFLQMCCTVQKKTIIYCKGGHVARLSLEAFRKPQTLNPNPRPWKSKVGMPSRTSRI